MKTLLLGLAAALAIGFICTTDAQAQIAKKKEATESFTIVDIKDQLQIFRTEDLEMLRTQYEERYKFDLEQYKAAKKRNPNAELEMPMRVKIEIVKTGLKDYEAAQIALEREMTKRNAAKAAAGGGEGGGPKKKPREGKG